MGSILADVLDLQRHGPRRAACCSARSSVDTFFRNRPPRPIRRSSQLDARQAMSSRCRQPSGRSSVTSAGLAVALDRQPRRCRRPAGMWCSTHCTSAIDSSGWPSSFWISSPGSKPALRGQRAGLDRAARSPAPSDRGSGRSPWDADRGRAPRRAVGRFGRDSACRWASPIWWQWMQLCTTLPS